VTAAPSSIQAFTGWKKSPSSGGLPKNKLGWAWVPNCSDVDNAESLTLGAGMLTAMGVTDPNTVAATPPPLPANPGATLENWVLSELDRQVPRLGPARAWDVRRGQIITGFGQYQHLSAPDAAVTANPTLRVSIGRDYLIKPDVTVGLRGAGALNGFPFLHAAVSCKWTIRSDRVQNVRHEFNQMIRHRRGRQPHLVTVTAEPLPSRLASIARGTGEVDATYHIAFDELQAAVNASSNTAQQDAWAEVVEQGRLQSFSDLAGDLTRW